MRRARSLSDQLAANKRDAKRGTQIVMHIGEIDNCLSFNHLQYFTLPRNSPWEEGKVKKHKGKFQGVIMKALNLKNLAGVSVLGLAAILGMSDVANAQSRGRDNDRRE